MFSHDRFFIRICNNDNEKPDKNGGFEIILFQPATTVNLVIFQPWLSENFFINYIVKV